MMDARLLAAEIADEQIAWWQARGVTAAEAWSVLTGWDVMKADGNDVRAYMIRWLLHNTVKVP